MNFVWWYFIWSWHSADWAAAAFFLRTGKSIVPHLDWNKFVLSEIFRGAWLFPRVFSLERPPPFQVLLPCVRSLPMRHLPSHKASIPTFGIIMNSISLSLLLIALTMVSFCMHYMYIQQGKNWPADFSTLYRNCASVSFFHSPPICLTLFFVFWQ